MLHSLPALGKGQGGNMKLYIRIFLTLLVIVGVNLPLRIFALGEFDGFWIADQDIYSEGIHERVTSPTVIYQQSEGEMYFWDDVLDSVRLVKSGGRWILPAPLTAEFLGIKVVFTSVAFTFHSSASMSGTIYAEARDYDVTVRSTISAVKQTCPALSNGQTLTNLAGAADSFKCYQIDLPANSRDLQVETWGGFGDCDLGVIYSRPDFDFMVSEDDYTYETVNVSDPEGGRYYIGLYGFEAYAGVNLQADFTEVPETVAQFGVNTWYGPTPLQITFSDQSSSNVTHWFWSFGDGSISYGQNPSHTYSLPGIYTVELTVSSRDGTDTKTVQNLIRAYSTDTKSEVEDFIARFYNLCLSREPDAGGLDYWVSSLLDGTRAGADVARGFVFSQEFNELGTSNEEYVTTLYNAFFDRDPDTDGYNYWLDKLENGEGRDQVLNGFIYATEFANLCDTFNITPSSDLTPVEAFLTRFYQLCLTRQPDPLGLDYWVSSILDGTRTGADVAYGFVFSAEFLNRSLDDATYLTILYRAFFDREPDSGGFDYWLEKLTNHVSREEVLDGFIFAQEFYNLCDEFGIIPN